MSRIGKKPIPVLDGVKVQVDGCDISVQGPRGSLQMTCRPEIDVQLAEDAKTITVSRRDDERQSRALHGLTRSLIQNMIVGVKDGVSDGGKMR